MFNNPFQDTSLQELQAKLELMKQQQTSLNPNQRLGGSFGKLQDFIQSTDKVKVEYANNDPTVIEKYNNMKDIFVLYMLENARPQFESWCKDRNIQVIDDYVDTFIHKSNEYIDHIKNTEIEMLKQQILELQQKLKDVT